MVRVVGGQVASRSTLAARYNEGMLGGWPRLRAPDPGLDPGTGRRVNSVLLAFAALGCVFRATTRPTFFEAIPNLVMAAAALFFSIGTWQKRRR